VAAAAAAAAAAADDDDEAEGRGRLGSGWGSAGTLELEVRFSATLLSSGAAEASLCIILARDPIAEQ